MNFGEEKSVRLLKQIIQLEPIEFLGICKIIGVSTITTEDITLESSDEGAPAQISVIPRPFEEIWSDVCDKVDSLNRTQRRNLQKLVKAATKEK